MVARSNEGPHLIAEGIELDASDANDLKITCYARPGRPSKSGKTSVLATTGGPVRVLWDGQWLRLNLSLYTDPEG